MPCDSSYMNANDLEKELSRVLLLLEELKTGKPIDPKSSDWGGYLPGVYGDGQSSLRRRADIAVAELCSKLQRIPDIQRYSLEMQMWWREHQEADRQREKQEFENKKKHQTRIAALAKLSEEERQSLRDLGL